MKLSLAARSASANPKSGFGHKNVVLTLVERGGKARSFHVDSTRAADVVPVVRANVAREAKVVTDEASHYMHLGRDFARHDTVNHGLDEYARYERDKDGAEYVIHTNTVEGYYLDLQTRHEGRLSALQRKASAPLPCRI